MKEDYPFLYDGYGLADYIVRSLNDLNKSDWHGDLIDFLGCSDNEELLSIISKWDKTCILHNIINGALYTYTEWYAYKISPEEFVEENIAFITKNKIQSGLKIYNLDYDENHDDELSQLYDDLIEKVKKIIADSCFILLFSDRDFLFKLQLSISGIVKQLSKNDYPDYLNKDGIINRPKSRFPAWLTRAIFFRDKGRCQLCGCDLSNLYTYTNKNFDHMIPLKSSGNNDPTNIQLTCEHCNKSKQANLIVKKVPTQRFW
ncbi:HNH endonuclease [Vibrio fluvialis]